MFTSSYFSRYLPTTLWLPLFPVYSSACFFNRLVPCCVSVFQLSFSVEIFSSLPFMTVLPHMVAVPVVTENGQWYGTVSMYWYYLA
jgi:hypothetical protein